MPNAYVSSATIEALLPEIVLIGSATLIFVAGAFVRSRTVWGWLAGAALAAAAMCLYVQSAETGVPASGGTAASSPLLADGLMNFVRWLSLGAGTLLLLTAAQGAAEGQAAGAPQLDQGELRHVVVEHRALDDGGDAGAIEDERDGLPRVDELAEGAGRIAGPGAGQEVGIFLHGVGDLAGLLEAVEQIDGRAVGRGAAADQDRVGAQPLQTRDVLAPVRLALRGVVVYGRDGHVEDDHGKSV